MPKKFLLSLVVLFSTLMIVTSCSKKDSGNGNVVTTTSITISADKDSAYADGIDKFTFTAKDQAGNDITAFVQFYIADVYNTTENTKSFKYGESGTYEVYAKKGTIVSNKITIKALKTGKYTTKIIADDFTGTWCGWCPRLTYKFGKFMENNPRIFTIGVHNNDVFALSTIEETLSNKFNITGYPTVILNRQREFNDNQLIMNITDSLDFSSMLSTASPLGLAINSSKSGNNLSITTKVEFDKNITQNLKLVVLVVEDGLIEAQANYYNTNTPGNPYYGKGNPHTSFVHNGVLRAAPSGILGENIPVATQTKNNIYTANHNVNISGFNYAKVKVVAFVTYADGQSYKGVVNAQWASAGVNKDFD